MDEKHLNEFLYLEPGILNMTSTSVSSFISVFEQIYGVDTPLAIDFTYRDMKMSFGPDTEVDLHIDYILQMRVMDLTPGGGKPHFYDEIPL